MTDDSRARILRTSLELFAARGFHAVSVREIAEQVGLTKTAVLYHFPSKSDIVVALVEPLILDTEAVLAAAGELPNPQERRWAVVTGLLDTWLSHGLLLSMHMRDQSLASDSRTFARLRDIALTSQRLIAGPEPDFAAQVRAAQVFAALSDPITVFADRPAPQLRAAILQGVQQLLGSPPPGSGPAPASGPATTPTSASGRGRPAAMTAAMAESARRMRDSGDYTIEAIASELGVSRATVYRHLTDTAAG